MGGLRAGGGAGCQGSDRRATDLMQNHTIAAASGEVALPPGARVLVPLPVRGILPRGGQGIHSAREEVQDAPQTASLGKRKNPGRSARDKGGAGDRGGG